MSGHAPSGRKRCRLFLLAEREEKGRKVYFECSLRQQKGEERHESLLSKESGGGKGGRILFVGGEGKKKKERKPANEQELCCQGGGRSERIDLKERGGSNNAHTHSRGKERGEKRGSRFC